MNAAGNAPFCDNEDHKRAGGIQYLYDENGNRNTEVPKPLVDFIEGLINAFAELGRSVTKSMDNHP